MITDLSEQILNSCRFCNQPEKERILYESDNFYVMLSLGPIVEGYTLLVSKKHISCCAEISNELRSEFEALYDHTKNILSYTYGACICYEHGRAGTCLIPLEGNKHCYHSHMHFVPVSIDLNSLVEKEFDGYSLHSLKDFSTQYKKLNSPPYLYVDDEKLNKLIYVIDKPIRRQYLRFKTAKALNCEHLWDWVTHQGWGKINSAIEKLSEKFTSLNK